MKYLTLLAMLTFVFAAVGCGDKEAGSDVAISPAPSTPGPSSNGERPGTPGGPPATPNAQPAGGSGGESGSRSGSGG